MSLELTLFVIIILSLFLLLFIPRFEDVKITKRSLYLYVFSIVTFLSLTINYYIGFGESGSPLIPIEKQRNVNHLGYYSTPGDTFYFGSNTDGIHHKALADGEKILLVPNNPRERKYGSWTIIHNTNEYPLRLNDTCINFSTGSWLNQKNDTVKIYFNDSTNISRFFSIVCKLQPSFKTPLGIKIKNPFRKLETYYYSEGYRESGLEKYDINRTDIFITQRNISEALKLSSMINSSDSIKTRINYFDPVFWEIFSNITFIREIKEEESSWLGVFISKSIFNNPLQAVYINSNRIFRNNDFRTHQVPSSSTLSYGIGFKNILSLKFSDESSYDSSLGHITELYLYPPKKWALPPKPNTPFLIASSNNFIPLDGYYIDAANSQKPFFSKALIDSNFENIQINNGKKIEEYSIRQKIRMGDWQQGVIISFDKAAVPYSYTGVYIIFFLLINSLLIFFKYHRMEEDDFKIRIDTAWTIIWALILSILCIRLIIAYRVSLIPPNDIKLRLVNNVFNKSFIISFWGLLVVPLLYTLFSYIGIFGEKLYNGKTKILNQYNNLLKKVKKNQSFKKLLNLFVRSPKNVTKNKALNKFDKLKIILIILPIVWILFGWIFGSWESIFKIRINNITHIFIIIAIIVCKESLINNGNLKRFGYPIFYFAVIFIGMSGFIKDNGFLIYGIPLLITLIVFGWWKFESKKILIFGLLIISFLLFIPFIPFFLPKLPLVDRVIQPVSETSFYRLKSFLDTQESVLLNESEKGDINLDMLLRNSHQHWQMYQYATIGTIKPSGYGQSPISDIGMTYPVTTNDCVFSIYILSEDGKYLGILFVFLFLFLAFTIIYASWFLPRGYQSRTIPLFAIASYFAFNAIYMAGANIGLFVFTGQNIPLMGLNSLSDLLQGGLFLVLVSALLNYRIQGCTNEIDEDIKHIQILQSTFLIGLLVYFLFFSYRISNLTSENLENHNFKDKIFSKIEQNLPKKEMNSTLKLENYKLIINFPRNLSDIENLYINQFNYRTDKFNPNGGLYYLVHRENSIEVRINRKYFILKSPFDTTSIWNGKIVTDKFNRYPLICGLGDIFNISLDSTGYAESIELDTLPPPLTNKSVLLKDSNLGISELIRRGQSLILSPRRGNWQIYKEGKKIKEDVILNSNEIYVIEKGRQQWSFIYLGTLPKILAFSRWQNGSEDRIFPEGHSFPLVYSIGKVTDKLLSRKKEISNEISLTLDLNLHRDLQTIIENYASGSHDYNENNPLKTKKLSVCVIDAHNGNILALPSWPYSDPTEPEFQEKIDKASDADEIKLLSNFNFTNHVIGSTVKPLTFAAIASELWPEYDLSELGVYNKNNDISPSSLAHLKRPPKHPHNIIANIPLESIFDCYSSISFINSSDFLTHSRDYYQVIIGMLGMFIEGSSDWDSTIRSSYANPDLNYYGRDYSFDLTKVVESPFTLKDRLPRPRVAAMDSTILFKGFPKLFQVETSKDVSMVSVQVCSTFFPSLAISANLLHKIDYISLILPDPIIFRPRDFHFTRADLISFLLGGGECRWNNIIMAEAAARLATGKFVNAKLEDTSPTDSNYQQNLIDLPEPLSQVNWRNNHLIYPMKRVGEIGTARWLRVRVDSPYRAIYKTGTMQESRIDIESEILLFVLGKWENNNFVPGQTIAGFLYMQECKAFEGPSKKFDFARPIITELLKYLQKKN